MVGGVLGACLGGAIHPQIGVEMGCSAPISTFSAATAMSPGFGDIINLNRGISHIYGPLTLPLRSLWGARHRALVIGQPKAEIEKKYPHPQKKRNRRPAQTMGPGRGPAQPTGPPPAGKPGRPSWLRQAAGLAQKNRPAC